MLLRGNARAFVLVPQKIKFTLPLFSPHKTQSLSEKIYEIFYENIMNTNYS
jgi:hypothetical protein